MLTERRSHRRMHSGIDATIFLGSMFYSARVLDISEEGMFINTKMFHPSDAMFIVIIGSETGTLKVIAKVERIRKNRYGSDGMGVKLLNTPPNYADFLKNVFPAPEVQCCT